MGLRSDQRAERSKALVHRALLDMLETRDMHRLSIRELCLLAGINRSTFYNHYGSQYDVLAEISDRYLGHIAQAIESAHARDRESVHSRVSLVFEYMEQNLRVSRLLIRGNVDEGFAQRLFSLPQIEQLLAESLGDADESCRQTIRFAIYGSYKLLQDWLEQDDRQSAADMAALVLRLAGAVCSEAGKN